MNWGAALTLGSILMLGGTTGGRGDELSGPDVTPNAGAFPVLGRRVP